MYSPLKLIFFFLYQDSVCYKTSCPRKIYSQWHEVIVDLITSLNSYCTSFYCFLTLPPMRQLGKEFQDALWSFRTMWLVRYQSSHSLLYPTTLLSTNGSFITFFIKVSWLPAVPFCHCPMEPLTPFSQLIKLSCISCRWYQPTGEISPPPHRLCLHGFKDWEKKILSVLCQLSERLAYGRYTVSEKLEISWCHKSMVPRCWVDRHRLLKLCTRVGGGEHLDPTQF